MGQRQIEAGVYFQVTFSLPFAVVVAKAPSAPYCYDVDDWNT